MAYDNDDLMPDEDDEVRPNEQEELPGLRRKSRQADKLAKENEALKRELAFTKVGLDLNDKRTQYFISGYHGELDPDAIRKEAIETGFLAAPAPPVSGEQQAAEQRIDRVTGGATTPGGNPEQEMEQAFATGGVDAMLGVVRKYGIPIANEQ